jgi:hypothetical protein
MRTNIKYAFFVFWMGIGQLMPAQILSPGLKIHSIESRALDSPRAAAMTADGNFVAVAVHKGLPIEDPSLVFFLLNEEGEAQERLSLVPGLREITSVVPAFDGGFVVSGSTKDNSGWLAMLSEKGNILAVYQEKGRGATSFPAIIQLSDGSFLVIVNDGDASYLSRMSLETDQESAQRSWKKGKAEKLGDEFRATAICRGKDNHYGITGFSFRGGKEKLAFLAVQVSEGMMKKNRIFISSKPELMKGNAILYDHYDDSYVVVGEYYNGRDTDGLWARFSADGRLKKHENFGKSSNESMVSLILMADKGFLAAGSYEYNRVNQAWLLVLDSLGKELDSQRLTHRLDQKIHHIFSNGDQHLTAIAHSSGNFGVLKVSGAKVFEAPLGDNLVSIDTAFWVEEVRDDTLNAGERSYFMVRVNNTSAIKKRIQAKVRFNNRPYGLFSHDYVYAESLPGEPAWLTIPFVGEALLASDSLDAIIDVTGLDGSIIGRQRFGVRTKAAPVPVIQIDPASVKFIARGRELGPEELLNRLDTITMQVEVRNVGKVAAKSIRVNLKLPYNIKQYENSQLEVDSIPAGKSAVFSLDFLIHSYYEYDDINLHVFAKESLVGSSDYVAFYRKVPDFFLISPPDTTPYIPRKIKETRERGGPYPPFAYPDPSDFNIIITAPNQNHEDEGKEIEVPTKRFSFSAKIYSPVKLEEQDVQVLIEEEVFDKKRKPYKAYRPAKENDEYLPCYTILEEINSNGSDTYVYIFKTKLFLEKGVNPFVLGIKNNSVRSESIKIEYRPPHRRLWVYAIGVPFDKGEPTAKSAELIGGMFRKIEKKADKQRKYFESANVKILIDPDKTSAKNIQQIISEISNQFGDDYSRNINDEHMILFFIATHGIIKNKRFSLAGSEWKEDGSNHLAATVDFEISFVSSLGNIPVSKFIILESCSSGIGVKKPLENLETKLREKYAFEILSASDSLALYDGLPVLTSALFHCLENKYFDDGLVSTQELFDCVFDNSKQILVDEYGIPEEQILDYLPSLHRWKASERERGEKLIIYEKEHAQLRWKCPELFGE